jgi:hypothetical protein
MPGRCSSRIAQVELVAPSSSRTGFLCLCNPGRSRSGEAARDGHPRGAHRPVGTAARSAARRPTPAVGVSWSRVALSRFAPLLAREGERVVAALELTVLAVLSTILVRWPPRSSSRARSASFGPEAWPACRARRTPPRSERATARRPELRRGVSSPIPAGRRRAGQASSNPAGRWAQVRIRVRSVVTAFMDPSSSLLRR